MVSTEKMNTYYKVNRRDGHIVRMQKVAKPKAYPSDVSEVWNLPLAKRSKRDFPIREYNYKGGKVIEESALDAQGDLRYKLVYGDGGKTATVYGYKGFIKTFENQISGFGYKFDDRGNVIWMQNRNAFGSPRSDNRNVVAYSYTYDDDGLILSESAFDAYGNAIEDKSGISTTKTTYDSRGLPTERVFYDRFGAIEDSVDGYAVTSMKYDNYGRLVMEKYGDRSKRPVQNTSGICAIKYSYDDDGKLIEKTTMSCSMHPKETDQGYATTRFEYAGDNISKQSYFNHTGKPAVNDDGVASIRAEYDDRGYISRLSFHGIDGKPSVNKKQFHAVRYIYDDDGRPTSRMFYGLDNSPMIASDGYAEARLQYGDQGNPTKLFYLDASGKPINSRDGYAIVDNEYDQFGNLTAKSFFDKDNGPAFGRNENCHRISYQYDDYGDLSEVRCFDGGGSLTAGIDSCAIQKYTYDNLGLRTKSECYINYDVLIDLPSIPSILTTSYDKRGHENEIRAYDASGELAERYKGAAAIKIKNDDQGNQLEVATYDRFGNLVDNPKYNAAVFHQEFDDRGNMVRAEAFDTEMHPTPGIWGFAGILFEYDSMDRRTSEAYIGVDGKPAISWRGVYGRKTEYDDRGRISRIVNVDQNAKPISDNDGIAITQYSYDEWDQLSSLSFEKEDGSPSIDRNNGCSQMVFSNDDRGNVVEIRCLEGKGKLCSGSGCIPIIEQSFDDKGHMVGQGFKGGDGKSVLGEDGAAGYVMTTDLQGRIETRSVIGLDGKPARDKFGIYTYQLHYRPERDESLWFMTFLDKDGKAALSEAGATARIVFFDNIYQKRLRAHVDVAPNGSIILTQCFDVAGRPSGHSGCVTSAEVMKEYAIILPFLKNKKTAVKYE